MAIMAPRDIQKNSWRLPFALFFLAPLPLCFPLLVLVFPILFSPLPVLDLPGLLVDTTHSSKVALRLQYRAPSKPTPAYLWKVQGPYGLASPQCCLTSWPLACRILSQWSWLGSACPAANKAGKSHPVSDPAQSSQLRCIPKLASRRLSHQYLTNPASSLIPTSIFSPDISTWRGAAFFILRFPTLCIVPALSGAWQILEEWVTEEHCGKDFSP